MGLSLKMDKATFTGKGYVNQKRKTSEEYVFVLNIFVVS